MTNGPPFRIRTITEYHRLAGLPKPEHALISVIDLESIQRPLAQGAASFIFDFYSISLKKGFKATMSYGHQPHDFDEGVLFCMSPGQVFGSRF